MRAPRTYICNIDLILVLFLPSLLRNIVYVKINYFLHNLLQNDASWNALYVGRGLLHFNINTVYSKVLQALEISGPKWSYFVNFLCTGRSRPLSGPEPCGFSLTSLMDDPALHGKKRKG